MVSDTLVSGSSPSNNIQKASPAQWKPGVSLANVLNQYLLLLVCKAGQSDLHRGNTHRRHLPIWSTKLLSFKEMNWSRSVVSNSLWPHGLYWSDLPFSSPGDLPNPGIEPRSPALQADALPSEPLGKPVLKITGFEMDWSTLQPVHP